MEFRVPGLGLRLRVCWGSGFKAEGFRIYVQGLGIGEQCLRLSRTRVLESKFRICAFGFVFR